MFTTRAYNTIEVDRSNGLLIKTSSEERLKNEITHYQNIPGGLQVWFPRYFSSGKINDKYFLELELYSYQNLGKYLIGEEKFSEQNDKKNWTSVAKLIFAALKKFSSHKITNNISKHCEAMYITKTLSEFNKLKQNFSSEHTPYDSNVCPTVVINQKEYVNFEKLWNENENKFRKILNSDVSNTFFHGDMCFSNILLGDKRGLCKTIKFVDPRGKFGQQMAYGEVYYDLAKLMHSTDVGYEYFIYDKFNVSRGKQNEYQITYDNSNKDLVHNIFSKEIYFKFNYEKIKLIQGLIFIGMCARHYDSQERQLAMYLSGVKTLNEIIK